MTAKRRRKKVKSTSTVDAVREDIRTETILTPNDGEEADESLWQTFSRHPFVRVLIFLGAPYILHVSYLYVRLQRPQWLRPIGLHLRPAVGVADERQVLIVGSMSSGTTQMASSLQEAFPGLEIGHEDSNAQWSFVRDGTVSWFHGVRFLQLADGNKDDSEDDGNHSNNIKSMDIRMNAALEICGDGKDQGHSRDVENFGFHPFMYREPQLKCSYRRKVGDKCWVAECYRIIVQEYGCEQRKDCESTYRVKIHQTRNPLRTIESLVAKFCQSTDAFLSVDRDPTAPKSFLRFARALFPAHNFDNSSCVEAMADFVVLYNELLLSARYRGDIDVMLRIEESTVCDVARAAGFTSKESTVYAPNYDLVMSACGNLTNAGPGLIKQNKNPINKGRVRLGWKDLRNESVRLEEIVKDLFIALGYDVSEE